MRWLRVVVVAAIVALLQISFLPAFSFGGAVPNLVLVAVVGATVWWSASEALLLAVMAGAIMDLAGGGMFGLALSSLVLLTLGLVALRQLGVDGSEIIVRLGLVVLASLGWAVIHVAALGLGNFGILSTWRVILAEIVLGCLLTPLVSKRVIYGSSTV